MGERQPQRADGVDESVTMVDVAGEGESRARRRREVDPWQDNEQEGRARVEGRRGGSPVVGDRHDNKGAGSGKSESRRACMEG